MKASAAPLDKDTDSKTLFHFSRAPTTTLRQNYGGTFMRFDRSLTRETSQLLIYFSLLSPHAHTAPCSLL